MPAVIGIDLGTTNTCVAVVESGRPVVISNKGGHKTTPSIVAVTDSGKRLVGQVAKRQVVTNAEHTVTAVKRLIGRKWGSPEVQKAQDAITYQLVEGPHGDVRVDLRGHIYSIPELSAFVLQEMKLVAEAYLDESVDRAVITVPAFFNDAQRQATKDAGRIAGLEVLRIINEPTAAAMAYGFGKDYDRKVAVFDLGGGTFDISILALAEGVFEVIATGGDSFLGGEDFDRRIIEWLAAGFLEKHGIELRYDKMAHQRLKDAAEKAKCELSTVKSSEINLPFIATPGSGGDALHLSVTLTREKLEELTSDLVDRCLGICEKVLTEAKVQRLDEVLLVGGQTRMPLAQRSVAEFFGREPSRGVHPDEAVALGAAIQGAALAGGGNVSALLLDVTPHALGIMIAGGYYHKLIERNSTIPCSQSHVFTTTRDNQTSVKILVLQGEGERAEENELLGEFTLTGLRAAQKGVLEVAVSFEISADGIVSVSARDLETNRQQAITVTARSGLTEEEIGRMVGESRDYMLAVRADEDGEVRKLDAQRLTHEIEVMWPQVEAAVQRGDIGAGALEGARGVLERGRQALTDGDSQAATDMLAALEQTRSLLASLLGKSKKAG